MCNKQCWVQKATMGSPLHLEANVCISHVKCSSDTLSYAWSRSQVPLIRFSSLKKSTIGKMTNYQLVLAGCHWLFCILFFFSHKYDIQLTIWQRTLDCKKFKNARPARIPEIVLSCQWIDFLFIEVTNPSVIIGSL